MPEQDKPTRRDLVKIAGAAGIAAAIPTIKAANDPIRFGMVGTGSRGTYLLRHLSKIDAGRCVALCDIQQPALDRGVQTIGTNPKTYKDYRDLLAQKDIDAVFVITPLYIHYPITKAALEAGKHVFCEKALVFRPEEVHGLRALAADRPKQVLQTGLQRRYSRYYQTVKDMVAKGILGDVRYVHAQWHRNMINHPSSLWVMKPGGPSNVSNWRLFRQFSGGLAAELTSHQVDVADWMFGETPEWVSGFGSIDVLKDGRDVYDNVQLVYRYPNGKQLTWSGISTNQHLSPLNSTRSEMAETIMGTDGTVEITVGDDINHCIAWWYREPVKETKVEAAAAKKESFVAGATMVSGPASRPIPLLFDDLQFTGKEGFVEKEIKYARRWLYSKGVLVQEEPGNPVDAELEGFFESCRTGKRPLADVNVGLADATAVMLSNQAMDDNRRVFFNEIDKMVTAAPAGTAAKNG